MRISLLTCARSGYESASPCGGFRQYAILFVASTPQFIQGIYILSNHGELHLRARITPGYCWPTSFKVLGVLFLGAVSSAFLPSKKACWTPKFRPWGVGQQYPPVKLTGWISSLRASLGVEQPVPRISVTLAPLPQVFRHLMRFWPSRLSSAPTS